MKKEDNGSCTRVVFSGDISFSGYFSDKESPDFLAPEILDYLKNCDASILNTESPFSHAVIQGTRTLNHISDPGKADLMKEIGGTVWSLGNNHIADCGSRGLADTIECAENIGAAVIGAGMTPEDAIKPFIVGDEVKVGVLSITQPWDWLKNEHGVFFTVPWTAESEIRETVKKLREQVRWVVLVVHGGSEFIDMPFPDLRNIYLKLLSLGADVIVGHHPHVVENYEYVDDKIIFYSLGNFIFDTDYQRAQKYTDAGILLGIDFLPDRLRFDHMAVKVDRKDICLKRAETPAIFCDIPDKEYRKLWPYAVKKYLKSFRISYQLLHPGLPKKNSLWFLLKDIKNFRDKKAKYRLLGRLLSLCPRHLFSEKKDVVRYLKEKT